MRRDPVLVGGVMTALGVLVALVAAVGLAREIARTPEWGPEWIFVLGGGVLLVLGGVGELRHQRRFRSGYREAAGGGNAFDYVPPGAHGTSGDMPSYGSGDGGGGGGGDCGGAGGGGN
ncbi:hypothetical protein ACN27B_01815 [Micromonospora sp. WMMD754]|uniref:hypothetical protein n=1 Tax=Micromonospora sp. WMMD754 TaxID=3404114 RepID=UPI003BF48126